MDNVNSPRFLKAADTLLPQLLKIPREVVKRHNLLFKDVIDHTMEIQDELPGSTLIEIYLIDEPYYKTYGMSKTEYEAQTNFSL